MIRPVCVKNKTKSKLLVEKNQKKRSFVCTLYYFNHPYCLEYETLSITVNRIKATHVFRICSQGTIFVQGTVSNYSLKLWTIFSAFIAKCHTVSSKIKNVYFTSISKGGRATIIMATPHVNLSICRAREHTSVHSSSLWWGPSLFPSFLLHHCTLGNF